MKLTFDTRNEEFFMDNISVLQILKSKFLLSERAISKLKRYDGIKVNGQTKFVNYIIQPNDILEVHIEDKINEAIIPENLQVEVLYEDEYICIANKPYNMPMHPVRGYQKGTLANWYMFHVQLNNEQTNFHAVNRLDMDTSGIVILAKNGYIHDLLEKDMQNGFIKKKYIALAQGILDNEDGVIDEPIKRLEAGKMTRCVDITGQKAITKYRLLSEFDRMGIKVSMVELELLTGRTHQIRVHMKHIGHPLLGDSLYNIGSSEKLFSALNIFLSRQALHAYKTSFVHPINKNLIEIETKLPKDLTSIVEKLS